MKSTGVGFPQAEVFGQRQKNWQRDTRNSRTARTDEGFRSNGNVDSAAMPFETFHPQSPEHSDRGSWDVYKIPHTCGAKSELG